MTEAAQSGALLAFVLTALRLATPLAYAALGGYASERSGTVNIALEGMMLIGAFTGAVAAHHTHSPLIGIAAAIAGATLLASLHAFLCITLGADQIISGVSVNLLAAGIPPVACKVLYDMSSGTPSLQSAERVPHLVGSLSPFVFGAGLLAVFFWALHRHTKLGQYIRFAGEHPGALASQGVSVARVRWIGVLISGALCGMAGAYLAIDHSGVFTRGMTAGRGYIALAALIIGRWTPLGAVVAALVFGVIEATQILLQGVTMPGGQVVSVQWIQMLPYVATLAILAGAVGGRLGKARAPSALGLRNP